VTVARSEESPTARAMLALAGAEGRRLLRPVPLAFLLLPAILAPVVPLYPAWTNDTWVYMRLAGTWVPLAALALAVYSIAATSRSDRSGTDELERCLPLPARARVAAHLLALAAPVGLVIGLTILVWLLRARNGLDIADGAPSGMIDPTWTPGPAELAQGPLVLTLFGSFGVLAGALLRRPLQVRWPVAVHGLLGILGLYVTSQITLATIWFGTPFDPTAGERALRFLPVVNPVVMYPGWSIILGVDAVGLAWHDLYLLGLIALTAWAALRRCGPHRRLPWLGLVGITATVLGGAAQVLSWPTAV
jgi:hypothetical protein